MGITKNIAVSNTLGADPSSTPDTAPLSISPADQSAALQYASSQTRAWMKQKNKDLLQESPEPLLGPTMDAGTYYWRLGSRQEGFGFDADQLQYNINAYKRLGFPEVNGTEIQFIEKLYRDELKNDFPKRNFVLKHFPGGNEFLETTEYDQMHYDGEKYPIANWIKNFSGAGDAYGIMLSHASYDLSAFPGIDKMPTPEIPDFIRTALKKSLGKPDNVSDLELFSSVPASINPYVTQYLRTTMHYSGNIVGDWYDMGSISQFAENIYFDNLVTTPTKNNVPGTVDKELLLGISAGVEYMRPFTTKNLNLQFWEDFQKSDSATFKQFDSQLTKLVASHYERLRKPQDPAIAITDIAKLPLMDRLDLIGSDVQSRVGLGSATLTQAGLDPAASEHKYKDRLDEKMRRLTDPVPNTPFYADLYRVLSRKKSDTSIISEPHKASSGSDTIVPVLSKEAQDHKAVEKITRAYARLRTPQDPLISATQIAKLSHDNLSDLAHLGSGPAEDLTIKNQHRKTLADLYRVINYDNQFTPNDIYSRTGVLMMEFRVKFVEAISGKKFPDAPNKTGAEEQWVTNLMADKSFKEAYAKIDWDALYQSPEVQQKLGDIITGTPSDKLAQTYQNMLNAAGWQSPLSSTAAQNPTAQPTLTDQQIDAQLIEQLKPLETQGLDKLLGNGNVQEQLVKLKAACKEHGLTLTELEANANGHLTIQNITTLFTSPVYAANKKSQITGLN